jgi:hypothetical protein
MSLLGREGSFSFRLLKQIPLACITANERLLLVLMHVIGVVWVGILAVVLPCSTAQAQVAGERIAADRLVVRVLSAPNQLDLDRRSSFYPYPFAPTDSIARLYRSFLARQSFRLDGLAELDAFQRALAWVGTRWIHHSENTVPPSVSTLEIIERAQKGERFTCVEYARVLVDILTAYGYPSRIVGLSRADIEMCPRGARHVAVEAWSATYSKWVFLDPQWGIYPCLEGQWLSAYELVQAIRGGKLTSIDLIPSPEVCRYYRTSAEEQVELYRTFIEVYTGYLDFPYVYEGKPTLLMCICDDSLSLPLAFQGMPISGLFYTRNWRKAYGRLDQLHATFTYTGQYQPQRGFTQPEYTLTLATTMPWIKYYQVRIMQGQQTTDWLTLDAPTYRWQLAHGINTIEMRAIGWNDLPSQVTSVTVFWGPAAEISKVTGSQQ